MITRSQLGQDMFVVDVLQSKRKGFFIDLGCGHHERFNNTYVLEKEYEWSGLAFDIEMDVETWKKERPNSTIFKADALKFNYYQLFDTYSVPKTIDYLSLDLEPPEVTLACLNLIPFSEYTFKVITFEVDRYRSNYHKITRPYFNKHGYVRVAELGFIKNDNFSCVDDAYIHHSIAEEYIDRIQSGWIFDKWCHRRVMFR
jgi:hypothetical protein